jgi:hypothetical protein
MLAPIDAHKLALGRLRLISMTICIVLVSCRIGFVNDSGMLIDVLYWYFLQPLPILL